MIAQLDSLYLRTSPRKSLVRLLSYAFFEGRPLTTKGQWINPLVFTLFGIEKRLPPFKAVKQPIFIIGTGRSGTSILGTLLSMHQQVGFLNEPKALWHAMYPEEDLVGTYARGVAKYRLTANDVSSQVHRTAHRLYSAYLTIVGAKRVVDKYPEAVFRIPFVRQLFPDAKFIFIVRNGWDTCQSIENWSERLGVEVNAETHDWWGADNRKWKLMWDQIVMADPDLKAALPDRVEMENPIDMAALEWTLSMREGLQALQEYPDCIHLVRYEDLVSTPEQCLSDMLEFCELPPDPRFLEYALNRLVPAAPRSHMPLHTAIQPFFDQMMAALDYDC